MKEKIANNIIDFGIAFIAWTAIPFNLITYFALENSEYTAIRFITPLLGISVILLALLRKRLPLRFKVSTFQLLLFSAALFSLLLGLLDTASLWFVLVIIYGLFTGSKNEALLLFIISLISTIAIGILMVVKNPYIPFNYGFEDCQFACVAVRIIDFLIIGFLIFYIIRKFLSTIEAYIDELSEKTSILEKLNKALQQEMHQKQINKKLEESLEKKNKKLLIHTLRLLNKSGVEDSLVKKINTITNECKEPAKRKVQKIIRNMQRTDKSLIWQEFEKGFIEINTSFYRNLNEKYPNLSKSERQLCAFLKLNMNTKDIANMLNITVRGVETSRYRLRKKMQLPKEKSLYNTLQQF